MTSETPTEAQQVAPRRGARPLVVGGVIAAVLFAAFAALAAARAAQATLAFDATVISVIHGMRTPWLNPVMVLGTNLGAVVVAVPVAVVLVGYLLFKRLWTAAALVLAVYGVGFYWGSSAQSAIGRIRPPQIDAIIPVPNAYSFPSGHSITAMLLYGAIAFLAFRIAERRWVRVTVAAVCVVLIVFVGFTRVYLGAHWPTDVIGAWLLGGAWLALIAGLYMAFQKRVAES
jgi:undecaprenyl-diphosphatase